jgi:hypothetical protein
MVRPHGISLLLAALLPSLAGATPGPPPAGYALVRISDAVPASFLDGIGQLAFQPGDPAQLYAVRPAAGAITRYDFDAASGALSNAVNVASGLPYPVGIAFRGRDLFVSLNPTLEGRLARLRDLDLDGTFEERTDFVRGLPRDVHTVNQIQIVGAGLYVGIGSKSSGGSPACETPYNGTIARIADLDQTDFGPSAVNLPDTTNFVDPLPSCGSMRSAGCGPATTARASATPAARATISRSTRPTSSTPTCTPVTRGTFRPPVIRAAAAPRSLRSRRCRSTRRSRHSHGSPRAPTPGSYCSPSTAPTTRRSRSGETCSRSIPRAAP